MTDRRGVILLFFDLPVASKEQRRDYRKFKSFLKKNAFVFVQESVYIKLIHNTALVGDEVNQLHKNTPTEGSVSILPLCFSDFSNYQALVGDGFDISLFADDIVYL